MSSYSKDCAYCKKNMKQTGNGKIWLIECDGLNDRVCSKCWQQFVDDDKQYNAGRGLAEMDRKYEARAKPVEDFLKWLKEEEGKQYHKSKELPETEKIMCWNCRVVTLSKHKCYGVEKGAHSIDGKPVCHLCWDNTLKGAVESSGY